MVDLPVPDTPLVTADMPGSRVNGSIFQAHQEVGIGSGLQAIAEGVDAMAQTAAEKEGSEDASRALQRNADGSLEVQTPQNSFILGGGGKAYQHAFNVGTLAGLQTNVNEQANALRNQFPNDPDGFRVAMGKYADGLREKFPGALGAAAFNHATQLGSQYYVGAVNEKKNADIQSSYQEITTRLTDIKTDIGNIARGAQTDSADFVEKLPQYQQLKGYYQSLVDNPEFKKTWTQAKADSELSQFRQEAVNNWALGNAQRIRDAQGIDAAVKWSEQHVRDSDSNMPFSERLGAHNMVLARITSLTQEQKAKAEASGAAIDGFSKLYEHGTPPSEEQYQAILQSARQSFDVAGAARLQAFHDAYANSIKPYAGLAPREGVSAVMGPQSNAAAQPFESSKMEGFLDRVKSIENPGGNPRAMSPTGAMGDFQFTRGTWAQFGIGDRGDPTANRAAARRLTQANAQALTSSLGRAPTEGELYLAHQQGSAGAAALLAHPDMNAVQALALAYGGNVAKADQAIRVNGGRPDMTAGEFAKKWTSRFDGQMVAGASSAVPFTPEQIKANPYLAAASVALSTAKSPQLVQYARDQAELIGKAASMGAAPSLDRVAQVMQIAEQHPRELADVATKMKAQIDASPIAMQAAGMPDGGASYVEQAQELARQSPDLYHMELAQAVKSQVEGRAKALTDDPHAYASRSDVGWLKSKPIAFETMANPGAIGADSPMQVLQGAIAQRREAGFQIGSRIGVAPQSAMFTTGDVKSLSSMLQRSDGPASEFLLRGLDANLHPDELNALASNKDFSNAVGGLTRSGDPQKSGAAFGFLDKQWRDNPEAFKKEYGADMATKLAAWQDKLAFMPPEQAMRELQKANDPSVAHAVAGRREEADKITKDLTSDSITRHLFGSWTPFTSPGAPVSNDANGSASAMLADYRSAYRDLYGETGDKTIAEKRALERVQMKWGASDLNGGRVMSYPPERYYLPDINGSRSYFQNQLDDAIHDASVKMGAQGIDPQKVRNMPRAIIADQQTQEDVASRKAPSYRVIVQDDAGQWFPLEARPGTPLRFFADRDAVVGAQSERAALLRRQSQFVQGAM